MPKYVRKKTFKLTATKEVFEPFLQSAVRAMVATMTSPCEVNEIPRLRKEYQEAYEFIAMMLQATKLKLEARPEDLSGLQVNMLPVNGYFVVTVNLRKNDLRKNYSIHILPVEGKLFAATISSRAFRKGGEEACLEANSIISTL